MTNKIKKYLLVGISVAAFVSMLSISPIRQDPAFHNFADGREIASISNFMNVISNLPFMLIGTTGLWMMKKSRPIGAFEELRTSCNLFFVGIFLTGIGSTFYHLNPNNFTLVWDRLPMTISFMALLSFIIGNFICKKTGKQILIPLILTGFLSIIYWVITEYRNCGDLRFYALVQYLPLLLIPTILLLYKANNFKKQYLWLMILSYGFAKLFEHYDESIFDTLKIFSGHTFKHLFAALVPLIFLKGLQEKISKISS